MSPDFLRRLDLLREEWGRPLKVTSGRRCREWNRRQGGATKSRHLSGGAVDFYFKHEEDVARFVALAEKHGFLGIGIGIHLVHLDDRKEKGRWTYNYILEDGAEEICDR